MLSGETLTVQVSLEREEDNVGPVIAPFFSQVRLFIYFFLQYIIIY